MSELIIRVNISREMGWIEDSKTNNYSLIISSHVLEGLKKRFTSMLIKTKLPYIIDPYTYVFTYNIHEINEKRWYPKLVGLYGLDLITEPDSPTLTTNHLIDKNNQSTDNLKELCENVLNYQRTRIEEIYEEISEFEDFEDEEETLETPTKPKWIIPPYFFLGIDSADWLKVNTQCIEYALENRKNNEKIFAVIMLDREMLSFQDDINQIVQEYDKKGIDGYFVWVAYMNENSPKKSELSLFLKFIEKLSKHNKPIYNMYGGLFSMLASNRGITGISHSICYGEHKTPFASSGMAATIRYYEPTVHSKVPFGRLDEIKSALDLKNCECRYCNEVKNTNEVGKQLELTGKHFLLKRSQEINKIQKTNSSALSEEIEKDIDVAKEKDVTGAYLSFYEKFFIWKQVLRT